MVVNQILDSAHELRRIAYEATCDPRTVRRYLEGGEIKSTSRARIVDALKRLGIRSSTPAQRHA